MSLLFGGGRRWILKGLATGVTGYVGFKWYQSYEREKNLRPAALDLSKEQLKQALEWRPPSRAHLVMQLMETKEFDLVVIGGGATGTGCALDGASRGLKVALIERGDYSSGTSSKSTKLVHGGVRYLEKAFWHLDWEQFAMVREALAERSNFLRIAPHLTEQLPIMLPIYNWVMVPYYWMGSKTYDVIAGGRGLESSYYLSHSRALEAFPMLKKDKLVGAMVYYDGAQNDARMNVALALTAIQQGAIATNYTEVVDLIKDDNGKICGVMVKDVMATGKDQGKVFPVRCKGVISATGPFCDLIRKMDDPTSEPLVQPSVGTHIVFPTYYSPQQMGLVDPNSTDGRVIFFLPWEGNTIAGTTDAPASITEEPKASEAEISFLVKEVRRYLDPSVHVRQSDVLAAWSGLRPLVRDPTAKSTQELVRNHILLESPSGLLTIAGGKWTTYRRMAEDTIDASIKLFSLQPAILKSKTEGIPLIGAHGYNSNTYIKLIQHYGLETDVAQHLAKSYGDRANIVAALCSESGQRWPLSGKRLIPWYPYVDGEVRYAVRAEYAQTIIDILARRTRLAHLSCQAARDVIPLVAKIMAEELKWSPEESLRQMKDADRFLSTCGIDDLHPARAEFRQQQLNDAKREFHKLQDKGPQWGRVSYANAIRGWIGLAKAAGNDLVVVDWKAVIQNADPNQVGSIGLDEFLYGLAFISDTK